MLQLDRGAKLRPTCRSNDCAVVSAHKSERASEHACSEKDALVCLLWAGAERVKTRPDFQGTQCQGGTTSSVAGDSQLGGNLGCEGTGRQLS